jgi:large subunit ribosomal protein L10Ae
MSKLTGELLSNSVDKVLAFSRGEKVEDLQGKKRNFPETIELQVTLRNYDPNKDKRFSGAFRLPVAPRPAMSLCILGSEDHCAQGRALGIDAMVRLTQLWLEGVFV